MNARFSPGFTAFSWLGVVAALACWSAGAAAQSTAAAKDTAANEQPDAEADADVVCCAKSTDRSPTAPNCPARAIDTREEVATRLVDRSAEAEQEAIDTAAAQDIAAAEKTCLGHPIADVEMQDCVGTRCQDEHRMRRFISLMDLKKGEPLKAGELAVARERMKKTAFFEIPHVYCRIEFGRARIAFKVKGNRFVRRIRFSGQDKIYEEELRGRLIFQPGSPLDPRTAAGRQMLRRQCGIMANLYQKRGHEDAVVRLRARSIGIGLIGVQVDVAEGAKHRVSRRTVTLHHTQQETEGERRAGLICRPVTKKAVMKVSGLDGVDVFAGRLRVKARARVRRYVRMLGYTKPKIEIQHVDKEQRITIDVRLGRCNIIRLLSRQTPDDRFSVVDDEALLDVLSFSESGVFDLDEAERGRRSLRALLENRGSLFADVRMEFRKVPRARRGRIDGAVTYFITTGYPAQIRGLTFPGLKHFTMQDVLEVIGTRRYDFFGDGGFLQIDQLLGDLSRLKQFYASEGYFEFGYALRRGADSRFKGLFDRRRYSKGHDEVLEYLLPDRGFRVRKPDDEHFIYVEVPVIEGRRSKLTKLTIEGAKELPTRRLHKLMGLQTGGVISYRRMLESLNAVERLYHDEGFFKMRFLLECEGRGYSGAGLTALKSRTSDSRQKPEKPDSSTDVAGGEPGKGATGKPATAPGIIGKFISIETPWQQGRSENRCSQARLLAEKVTINLTIDEGQRMRMGEVFISGNFDTEDHVLVRDLPTAGRPFSKPRLFEAQRKLRNLGLFDSVTFEYIGVDEEPVRDHIAVLVRVVESESKEIQVETGFQTINAERQTSASGASLVTTPSVVADHVEHLTSNQQRLLTGYGTRMGVALPALLLTGGGSFAERNWFGYGWNLELRGQLGWTLAGTGTELVVPELVNIALSYVNRRFLDTDATLRIIAPYYIRDYATITIDIEKFGGATEISKRLGRLYITGGFDVAMVRTRDVLNRTVIQEFTLEDFTFQWKVIPRITWDSTDSPLNPTRGVFMSVTAPLINAELIDANTGKHDFSSFLKLDATAKFFAGFAGKWVLATMFRFCGAAHLNLGSGVKSQRLPTNERCRLGGALGLRGFSDGGVQQSTRGGEAKGDANLTGATGVDGKLLPYACAELNPVTGGCRALAVLADGDVMMTGAVELRTPPIAGDWLALAAFWDFGGVAEDLNSFYWASMRHGVGGGIRVLISGQIPVRLDIATPIGQRCLIPGVATNEACSNLEAPVQFHAGLLYAF